VLDFDFHTCGSGWVDCAREPRGLGLILALFQKFRDNGVSVLRELTSILYFAFLKDE